MPYYKLIDQNLRTCNNFQWKLNKWVTTDGKGELCSKHWLHCYNSPLLAVLLNPIHANVQNPRLFQMNVRGKRKTDDGLKFGFTKMRLAKELPLPILTLNQKIAFSILCAKQVYKNKDWNKWADNWLSGKDRSRDAADAAYADAADTIYAVYAADAAYAAAAADAAYAAAAADAAYAVADAADAAHAAAESLNLIKMAKQALQYN